eukprot:40265_1
MDTDTYDEEDVLIGDNTDQELSIQEKHQHVLNETKKVSKAYIVSSCVAYFTESMTIGIWMMYAQSLPGFNDSKGKIILSCLAFSQQIFQVIGIIFTSYYSDKYGFDTLAIITATLLLIAFLLKCLSYNLTLFVVGFILQALIKDDIEVLSLAFFGKFLPYEDAIEYTSLWYSLTSIPFVIGFAIGG